jgi:hypothetical protein
MGARRLLHRLAASLGLALLAAGCLPESENPLTPPGQGIEMPELLGLWQTPIEDARLFVHVLRGEAGELHVVTVAHEADGTGDTELYVAHVSDIDGRRFANLRPADATAPQRYIFVGIDLGGTSLTSHMLAPEALAEGIRSGALEGEVEEGSLGLDVRLTGPGERIAAFLAGGDPARLFGQSLTLQRAELAP